MVSCMAVRTRHLVDAALTIRPANEASWGDLQKILSSTAPANCQCQRYKMRPKECFVSFPAEERADRLRIQTDPAARTPRRPPASSPTLTTSQSVGAPLSPALPTWAWCAAAASHGPAAQRTGPTNPSGR